MTEPGLCDDCGISFVLREGSESCPKCTKLSKYARDAPEYQDIMNWPQCTMCGVTRRNMQPTGTVQICGATECKDQARCAEENTAPLVVSSTSNVNTVVSDANAARVAATRARLKLPIQTPSATTTLSTATLQDHQHGGGAPGEPKTFVCFHVRVSNNPKRLDDDLGSGAKKYANSLLMIDIKSMILQSINTEWVRRYSAQLVNEEVSYRFAGNRLLQPNTLTLTLGEFYAYYSSPVHAGVYIDNVPKAWQYLVKNKTPILCFEMYIDFNAFERRICGDENIDTPSVSRKKRTRVDSLAQLAGQSKQARRFDFSSSFNPSRAALPLVHRSAVTFNKINCTIDPKDGSPSYEVSDIELHAFITDKPTDHGSMKVVYDCQLVTDGASLAHVVKRFFRLSDTDPEDVDTSSVSIQDNELQVKAELGRLKWGKWFLADFYKFCKSQAGVMIDTNITFTDAFLANEIGTPSVASGLTAALFGDEPGITWIVEPKRASTVIKFSGTNDHRTQRRDLCSQTIYAFAHYAWGHSNFSLVFADIQGTPIRINGKDGMALFDVMTHTLNGESGIGDHGVEGIKLFLSDHKCLDICKQLGLDSIPLTLRNAPSAPSEDPTSDADSHNDVDLEADEVDELVD